MRSLLELHTNNAAANDPEELESREPFLQEVDSSYVGEEDELAERR